MNRVLAHIETVRPKVEALEPDARAAFDREMDITPEEHFAFQNAQSLAHASGRLTTDEAMVVYRALGEFQSGGNGGWTAGTDLPTKVTVTMLVTELQGAARLAGVRS